MKIIYQTPGNLKSWVKKAPVEYIIPIHKGYYQSNIPKSNSEIRKWIEVLLTANKIKFKTQISFSDFGSSNGNYLFHYYIPKLKIAINYSENLEQGSKARFIRKLKEDFCWKNRIRFLNLTSNNIETLEEDILSFINK